MKSRCLVMVLLSSSCGGCKVGVGDVLIGAAALAADSGQTSRAEPFEAAEHEMKAAIITADEIGKLYKSGGSLVQHERRQKKEVVEAMSEKNKNLVSQVYDYVMNMIMTKEIKCGERIPETMIAQKLNISRTPIREALRLIANAGIIKIYPKRFAEVITFSEQDIKDLGFVRIMLDTIAAQLAIVNGSNADFAKLKEITDSCLSSAKDGDAARSIDLDCDFHMTLSYIAGNPFLIDMQKDLYLKVKLLLNTAEREQKDAMKSIEYHYEIIDRLYKRDVDSVIKAIYEHLTAFYKIDMQQYKTFHFNINDIAKITD